MNKNYKIIESAMEDLDKKIKSLNKKRNRKGLNIEPINYNVNNEVFEDVEGLGIVKMLEITLTYEIIKIQGYTIIAQLDHEYESGNIVRMIDTTKKLDNKYYSVDCNCEHCNINRQRNTTYIIEDVQGNLKQIGRTCLNNYIGINIDDYVSYLEDIESIEETVERLNGSSYDKFYINTKSYLEVVNKVIEKFGYISKAKAMELTQTREKVVYPTCRIALEIYENARVHRFLDDNKYSSIYDMFRQGFEDTNEVLDAIEWIKSLDTSNNEYLNNLKIFTQSEFVQYRDIGYVSSLLQAYFRAMDKRNQDMRQKTISNFVGDIGEKLTIEVTVDRIINFDTPYGIMHIHLMHDRDENIIVYKGSKYLLENDDRKEITIKCSIKEHIEYDGKKQTVVQRPKVI